MITIISSGLTYTTDCGAEMAEYRRLRVAHLALSRHLSLHVDVTNGCADDQHQESWNEEDGREDNDRSHLQHEEDADFHGSFSCSCEAIVD